MLGHNSNTGNQVEIKITQDKLVDLLMHAATREDIARLDERVSRLDDKIDDLRKEVREDIARLDCKVDALRKDVHGDISHLDAKIDKLMLGIITSILLPILMFVFQHFIK